MNRNDTSTEGMSPAEYAELVGQARELVTAVERAIRRTGAVFVTALGLTIAATALGLDLVATLAAALAVTALAAALVTVIARIALGPMPPEVAPDARNTPPSASDRTSTTNGGISRM